MSNEGINSVESQEPKMTIEKKLSFVTSYSNDIIESAAQVEAMLAEAKERGIDVNIDMDSERFDIDGEFGRQLANIRSGMDALKSSLFLQGVEMTQEDMEARMNGGKIIEE